MQGTPINASLHSALPYHDVSVQQTREALLLEGQENHFSIDECIVITKEMRSDGRIGLGDRVFPPDIPRGPK